MKKIFYYCTILLLALSACKKDNSNNDVLQQLADKINIVPIKIYASDAVLSFIVTNNVPNAQYKLQIKKTADTGWMDVVYLDRNNIPVSDLSKKTSYDARVAMTQYGTTRYSKTFVFTTQSFSIDFTQFYNIPNNWHDNGAQIFSIEGAHHIIHGQGFSNETTINVLLTAVDDANDQINLTAQVINDTMISFDIPKNCISNSPYVLYKTYHCMIGGQALIGYNAYLNGNKDLLGEMRIINRDIVISNFSTEPFLTCKKMTITGYFATHDTATVCPETAYSVSLWIIDRQLIIRSGASIVTKIPIKATGDLLCDANGLAIPDPILLSSVVMNYHEVSSIQARSTLSPGNYTIQIVQTCKDGTVLSSNEYPISF